jgi:hypothetical protein
LPVSDQSRSQLSPQLQFSQPQASQLQFSQVPSLQPHSSQVQLSPQQQPGFAAEPAETELKPKTEAPATNAPARNFDVMDMIVLQRINRV